MAIKPSEQKYTVQHITKCNLYSILQEHSKLGWEIYSHKFPKTLIPKNWQILKLKVITPN